MGEQMGELFLCFDCLIKELKKAKYLNYPAKGYFPLPAFLYIYTPYHRHW